MIEWNYRDTTKKLETKIAELEDTNLKIKE